jgi:molecular chaperone HscB
MNDHFHRLGLPRRFALDAAELERAYLALSRAVHPDYHLDGPSADLGASLELSAAVNEAYNTLRDPFTRADHLLALAGGPTAAEHRELPASFLGEMLDLREQLETARGDPPTLERLAADFAARYNDILAAVGVLFDRYETAPADGTDRATLVKSIRASLNAAKYVRGLIRDLGTE